MSYTNADGLRVLTDGDAGTVRNGGVTNHGVFRKTFDLTELGTAISGARDPYDAFIPAGAVIEDAVLVVTTAATSSGGGTLTIGTYNAAGEVIDADGVDAAIAVTAIDADNDVVRCDGAQVGGVGGKLAANAYVEAIYATGAFQTGVVELVIHYTKVE
jgi:hypothetical protein